MAKQIVCPDARRVQDMSKEIIQGMPDEITDEFREEVSSALAWLADFLLTRRNYQRKQQLKKKEMARLIKEYDLDATLDESIAAKYGENLERFDQGDDETDE